MSALRKQKNQAVTGAVTQIIGPVVDVSFPEGRLPAILNAIDMTVDGRRLVMVMSGLTGFNQRIEQLDGLITDQLNEIMHAKEFQKLEGSWRGLNYLVMKTETGKLLKLRLLNIT